MIDKVKIHLKKVNEFETNNSEELQNFKVQYLGKKGILNNFFNSFRDIPVKEKKEFGKEINILKKAVNDKIIQLKTALGSVNKKKTN